MSSDDYYIYSGCKDNIIKAWQFKELSPEQIDEQRNPEISENSQKALNDLEQQYGKYKADTCSYLLGHSTAVNSI